MRLIDVLNTKGGDIAAVLDNATVGDVASVMHDKGCGSVVVRTRAGSIVGIANERAVVQAITSCETDARGVPVADIMLSPVPTAEAHANIIEGFRAMTDRRFRHLVVTRRGEAAGIVSIGDLVKYYIRDMEMENAVLRDLTAANLMAGRERVQSQ